MTDLLEEIAPFTGEDVAPFLSLASLEGWISERWEMDFLLTSFPGGCFTARREGRGVGFVTSISYGRHGWIGNLLVEPSERGKGVGGALMGKAIEALDAAGAETIWLTASPAGKPIYERLGFRQIDTIRRWTGHGELPAAPPAWETGYVESIDRLGWGEARTLLLDSVSPCATVYAGASGFLMAQHGTGYVQLGPWGFTEQKDALDLLSRAFRPHGEARIVFDAPVGNGIAEELVKCNFSVSGSTALMFRGVKPDYRPRHIGALATLGSIG